MATKPGDRYGIDSADGERAALVNQWSTDEKHTRLRHYVHASFGARKKLGGYKLPMSYIDVYCGPGRVRDKKSGKCGDGSPLVAVDEADKTVPFSEVFIGDADAANVALCAERLKVRTSTNVQAFEGAAVDTVKEIAKKLHPSGLHFAFLDPYSLSQIPFEVIQTLGAFKRMDLLIHVSEMDMQRNVGKGSGADGVDAFAPGWRGSVNASQRNALVMLDVFSHWRTLVTNLGYKVCDNIQRVTGHKNQPLYWLVLVSKHKLAEKLWDAVCDVNPQGGFAFKEVSR
jgi:three-Cys-motif partner protein